MTQEHYEMALLLEKKCEKTRTDFFISLGRLFGAVEMHFVKENNELLKATLEYCKGFQKTWLEAVRDFENFQNTSEVNNGYEKGNGTCPHRQEHARNPSGTRVQDEHEDEQGGRECR